MPKWWNCYFINTCLLIVIYIGVLNELGVKINEQIVEQYWSLTNKLKCLRQLGKRKFRFSLFLKREHFNHQIKLSLESKGFVWEPVTNYFALRNFDPTRIPNQIVFQTEEMIYCETKIANNKRATAGFKFKDQYFNVWDLTETSVWPTHLLYATILNIYEQAENREAFQLNKIKEVVDTKFGDGFWDTNNDYILLIINDVRTNFANLQ